MLSGKNSRIRGWAMPVQFTSIKEEQHNVGYEVGMSM